jgi:phage terminase large subunit-like protein
VLLNEQSFTLPSPDELELMIALCEKEKYINFEYYNPLKSGHLKHLEFHRAGKYAQERALFGGNRSGKTNTVSIETSQHVTGRYSPYWEGYIYDHPLESWVCSVTSREIKDLERRFFEGINEPPWIHPSLIEYHSKIDHMYKIRHSSGGLSTMVFKTYAQGRETYQATKLDHAQCDEEPPYEILSEIRLRLMKTSANHHGMLMLAMTPLMGVTRTYLHFSQKLINPQDPNSGVENISEGQLIGSKCYFLIGWDDAPHLPKEEQERLISGMSPHEIEARTKGIPSLGSGMVYPIMESFITCDPFPIPEHWPRVFGLDFGINPDPTAAAFIAHDRDNDILYVYGEYSMAGLTPQHHAVELMKQGADWIPCIYDTSGNAISPTDGERLTDMYADCGIRFMYPAEKKDKEASILEVLQRMQSGKLKIFKTCFKTMTELRMYARNEKGLIIKGNDHILDSIRYGIRTGLKYAAVRNPKKYINRQFEPNTYSESGSWMI